MKLYMEDIEDIILGIAEVVRENRILRQRIKDLNLECRKYKAYTTGDYKEGERLSDLSIHNAGVTMARNMNWLISDDELRYD